jgi:phospholipid transport system substrate-binding protein
MSDAQKDGFTQEFKKHLSLTYGRRLESYSNEKIEVGTAREEKGGDASVKTKVLGGSANGVEIEYRMHQEAGQWRVIDVTIEGVSLIANFRSQVQDIIRAEGADKLIEKLRQKNNEKATAPAA